MAFNIHKLDKIDSYSERAEGRLEDYQDDLMEFFLKSPEGQERLKHDPEMGFWAAQLIYYGFSYVGVSLPQMKESDVQEILTEVFPRKISTSSPEAADDTIPELITFWQFLKREFKLPRADQILNYLKKIEPGYQKIMNDSSKFGMAKSFFMMGSDAGFDMTNQDDMNQFMKVYNASITAKNPQLYDEFDTDFDDGESRPSHQKKLLAKKKKARKLAKASRKQNRKKRR